MVNSIRKKPENAFTSSLWSLCSTRCFNITRTSKTSSEEEKPENDKLASSKKPGGWKAMPYILGNETFERLATFGLLANFMVYLSREFHMSQVSAANVINIWMGFTNFAPLVGAFISDAYAGRFRTIAFASVASFLGMVTITLTAWLPKLHPSPCTASQIQNNQCGGPSKAQLGILFMGLGLLSVGTGGIRPCSIPFGVDQFDFTTDEGRKGINSFYNWYYTTFTVVILITQTLVVYIQDSISWVLGFGIPTIFMAGSIVLFFVGTRIYIHVKPEGSIFTGIVQVFVAAYRKRWIKIPAEAEAAKGITYHDPPPPLKEMAFSKLPLTDEFRFFNKAAIIIDHDELSPDGSPKNGWSLCSVQQIEEVKCLIRVGPIWASGIIALLAMTQQGTFTISQALKMDRHLGPHFQIPAGSITVISMITIGLWLPFYDRILVPALRKITKHEGGITLLQRIGIGIVFSILSMAVAGFIERDRRASAISHPQPRGIAPMSVLWLAPQLILMGLCEAFNIIGQIEFFNEQFPQNMRSIANSLFFCSFAGSSYVSSLVTSIVHKVTKTSHRPDWLTNDINAGRLDYFYFLLAGMGLVNFLYFLFVAHRYRYKKGVELDEPDYSDIELSKTEEAVK